MAEHLAQKKVDLKIVIHQTELTYINSPKKVEFQEFKDSIVLVNTIINEKLC
jgi:hypothetical protein